jgi:hypothetical protein
MSLRNVRKTDKPNNQSRVIAILERFAYFLVKKKQMLFILLNQYPHWMANFHFHVLRKYMTSTLIKRIRTVGHPQAK